MINILEEIITISKDNIGKRLDLIISQNLTDISRSQVQNLIEQNLITVNDKHAKKKYIVKLHDKIKISIPDPTPLEAKAENIYIEIVYEDDDLMVVNKPKGLVVHPAPGHPNGTLVNALLHATGNKLSGINGVLRPGIVHRIDKDTSGLLIVAKNDFAHRKLAVQIKNHKFRREYETVVHGIIKKTEGTLNYPIGRNIHDRKKMSVTYTNSKEAITHYKVINQFEKYAHLRLTLTTGRTHQIRVHMAYIGHPVAGDQRYGPKNTNTSLHGQCLHAKYIGFTHPRTERFLEFESDLPDYFKKFLSANDRSQMRNQTRK